jgi:RND family efflux transporter MFP subunit
MNERDLLRLVGASDQQVNYKDTPVPVFAGIESEEGYPGEGRLDFASTGLDPGTGTILLRAVFPNPRNAAGMPAMVPGMFVRLRIPTDVRDKALLVSERALGVDQGGRYLLTVDDRNVVEQRPVKTGALVNGMRVIEEGLRPDDWVVVSGIQRARPGAKVTPVKEGAAPAAAAPTQQ